MSSYRDQVEIFERRVEALADENGVVWFDAVADLELPRPPAIEGSATPEELAALDWDTLVRREPRLEAFYQQCVELGALGGSETDRHRRFTRELRRELEFLVGWHADTSDPVLRSQQAWEVAYHRCLDAILDEG